MRDLQIAVRESKISAMQWMRVFLYTLYKQLLLDMEYSIEFYRLGLPAHLCRPADFVSSAAGSVEVIWSFPHLELLLSLHALGRMNGDWWTDRIKEGCVGEGRGLFEPSIEQWWKHIHQVFHSEVPACCCERDHHSFWQYLVFRGIGLN